MPIVPRVARTSLKVRAAVFLIYSALVLGGATMVYPFMVMLTASMSNRYDYPKYQALPTAMWRPDELIWKFVFARFDHREFLNFATLYTLRESHPTWESLAYDPQAAGVYFDALRRFAAEKPAQARRRVEDYYASLAGLDPDLFIPLNFEEAEERFQDFLRDKYGAIAARNLRKKRVSDEQAMAELSRSWGVAFDGFYQIRLFYEINHVAKWQPPFGTARYEDLLEFKRGLEPGWRLPVFAKALWHRHLAGLGSIEKINQDWGTAYATRYEIPFRFDAPPAEGARQTWREFLQEWYPRRLIRLAPEVVAWHRAAFASYLRAEFGSLESIGELFGAGFASFDDIPLPEAPPRGNTALCSQWMKFITERVPFADFEYWSGEDVYRQSLIEKYGSLEAINQAHGAAYASLDAIDPPCQLADLLEF